MDGLVIELNLTRRLAALGPTSTTGQPGGRKGEARVGQKGALPSRIAHRLSGGGFGRPKSQRRWARVVGSASPFVGADLRPRQFDVSEREREGRDEEGEPRKSAQVGAEEKKALWGCKRGGKASRTTARRRQLIGRSGEGDRERRGVNESGKG